MPSYDPRIDAYIEKSADFAKPILEHLRELVHKTCPDVEEAIKWGMPFFMYKNDQLCHFSSFKQHCAFGFWKAPLMKDPLLMETAKSEVAMGHLGRLTSLKDLPADKKIASWIKEAMDLNDKGIKVPKAPVKAIKEVAVPDYFAAALKKNKAAQKVFDAFSGSAKKEYVTWLEEAKTEATRLKRLEQAIEWIAEGKQRNWKYMK